MNEPVTTAGGPRVPDGQSATAAELAPADRRLHDRVPLGTGAAIYELDDRGQPTLPAECLASDISRSGLGVRSRKMVQEGRRLFIVFDFDGASMRRRVLFGVVRNLRYDGDGMYHIGVEFEAAPATPAIKAWLRTLAPR